MRCAAIALGCLLASPVAAEEAQQGVTPQCGPITAIDAAKAAGAPIVALDEGQRDRAMAVFNSWPPPSDLKPEHVWIIRKPDHSAVAFIFQVSPQAVCGVGLTGKGMQAIMRAIEGDPA